MKLVLFVQLFLLTCKNNYVLFKLYTHIHIVSNFNNSESTYLPRHPMPQIPKSIYAC